MKKNKRKKASRSRVARKTSPPAAPPRPTSRSRVPVARVCPSARAPSRRRSRMHACSAALPSTPHVMHDRAWARARPGPAVALLQRASALAPSRSATSKIAPLFFFSAKTTPPIHAPLKCSSLTQLPHASSFPALRSSRRSKSPATMVSVVCPLARRLGRLYLCEQPRPGRDAIRSFPARFSGESTGEHIHQPIFYDLCCRR
jgi:hypothetical protein